VAKSCLFEDLNPHQLPFKQP